jgi:hypothetical protein
MEKWKTQKQVSHFPTARFSLLSAKNPTRCALSRQLGIACHPTGNSSDEATEKIIVAKLKK